MKALLLTYPGFLISSRSFLVDMVWLACGPDLANRSRLLKCHQSLCWMWARSGTQQFCYLGKFFNTVLYFVGFLFLVWGATCKGWIQMSILWTCGLSPVTCSPSSQQGCKGRRQGFIRLIDRPVSQLLQSCTQWSLCRQGPLTLSWAQKHLCWT